MAYTQAELSGPVNFGDDKLLYFYDGSDSSDTLATINTAGYFNNSDDDQRFAVDHFILVKGSDGEALLQVTAVSSGSVTTKVSGVASVVADEDGTTSTNLSAVGKSGLDLTTAATYTLDTPFAGAVKYVVNETTAAHVVSAGSGITFDGTNGTGTFLAAQSAMTLLGRSATRWDVVSVYPTSSYVAFS